MRYVLAIAAAIAIFACRPGATAPAVALSNCGVDRPEVQTLTDPNAGDVDTDQIIGANLSTLASVPIPNGLAAGTRFNPYETTVWATLGDLVQAQLDADGAIDLTVSDPDTGDTLTAVFPDAARCAASADPSLLQLMEQARSTFVQAFGMPPLSGALPLSGQAEVAGVGFMPAGRSAEQGGSGSGIEISPVLGFLAAPAASPAPAPAPAATPAPLAPASPAAPAAAPTATPSATPSPASTSPVGGR